MSCGSPSTCEDEFRPKTRRHRSSVRSIQTARTGDGARDELDQRQESAPIREIGYRGLERYGGWRSHLRRDERNHNGIEWVRENPSKVVVNGAALVPNIDVVASIFVMERGAGFSEVELRASLIECIGRMERKQGGDPCGLGNHEKPKQPGSTASHRPPNDHANRPNLRGPPGLDLGDAKNTCSPCAHRYPIVFARGARSLDLCVAISTQ